jgi:hypothetical protein
MPADDPNHDNPLLINDEELLEQETRSDVYAQGHHRMNNLNRLINKFNDKQTILRLLREKQLNQVDPQTLAAIAQTDNPVALQELKTTILSNATQYDMYNAFMGMLNDIQESLKYMKDLTQYRRRKGIIVANTLSIKVNKPVVSIDLEGNETRNLQPGQHIRLPRQKAYKIWVKNRGGGTLKLGLPHEYNDTIADMTLTPDDPAFEIDVKDPTLQFVNLQALTTDVSVEMRFFI